MALICTTITNILLDNEQIIQSLLSNQLQQTMIEEKYPSSEIGFTFCYM